MDHLKYLNISKYALVMFIGSIDSATNVVRFINTCPLLLERTTFHTIYIIYTSKEKNLKMLFCREGYALQAHFNVAKNIKLFLSLAGTAVSNKKESHPITTMFDLKSRSRH